ncbi:MAG: purine-nucleoside phosphorylase, partial [Bacilli bacterium]|nr:purine-nucleoside phosphorylase [Bacilli bacterium]
MIPTPHLEITNKDLSSKTVLMPGDPLRAKHIAE